MTNEVKLVDSTPYYFSPSFINHNGQFATILQLYVRTGSNRELTFTDIIDFIPTSNLNGVEMHFIVNDAVVVGDEKKRIIRKNASYGKKAIEATQDSNNEESKDKSRQIIMKSEFEDYDDYEAIIDSNQPIIGFKVQLLLIGPSREIIDEQIETINIALNQRHEGAKWDSIGGDQSTRFTSLFSSFTPSLHEMSSTCRNYSGLNFVVSSGLVDPKGVPIGKDVMSLTQSSSFFDFDSSLHKLAFIAAPSNTYMPSYVLPDSFTQMTLASIMAQSAANQIVMNGHNAHHIVLNGFDYFATQENGESLWYRPKETEYILEKYDVSKMTINPIQGFGSRKNVTNVYQRLVDKIVNLFNILQDLKIEKDDRAIILKAIDNFYMSQGLWSADAEQNIMSTRIVEVPDPETLPTLATFVQTFTNLAEKAAKDNRELKADRIDSLHAILSQALAANLNILGKTTSIVDSNALQTYYDFSNVESLRVQQLQFVNIIDYILHRAVEDDVVIIHGAQRLYQSVGQMVLESIRAAQDRGVRFIFAFDEITATKNSTVDDMLDMFSMKGSFYSNIESEVDYLILGRCRPEEIDQLEETMATSLSKAIRSQMTSDVPNQMLVHSGRRRINNFVYTNVII